jgi:Fe-S oxidoreductase
MDISEFLLPKLADRLKEKNLVVTWHDPCVLGRHLGDYETPRDVIRSIPGVQLVERRSIMKRPPAAARAGL